MILLQNCEIKRGQDGWHVLNVFMIWDLAAAITTWKKKSYTVQIVFPEYFGILIIAFVAIIRILNTFRIKNNLSNKIHKN